MGPILAVGSAGIDQVVHNEHGAVRGIVREDAQFIHHVIDPDDVRVVRTDFRLRFSGANDVLGFIHEWAVIAVGQAFGVQADDFAPAGDEINAIAFDAGRRQQAQAFPIVDFARGELGNDELPEELAGLFVKAKQDAAVALMLRVAGIFVVRADEDFSAGDDHVAISLRSKFGHPLDVPGGLHVDLLGAGLGLAGIEPVGQTLGG